MTQPLRYLWRMGAFLALVAAVAALLGPELASAFAPHLNTPPAPPSPPQTSDADKDRDKDKERDRDRRKSKSMPAKR